MFDIVFEKLTLPLRVSKKEFKRKAYTRIKSEEFHSCCGKRENIGH